MNNLNEFSVGNKTFKFESKEKVKVTLERIEQSFDREDVERYKQNNTKTVQTFKLI